MLRRRALSFAIALGVAALWAIPSAEADISVSFNGGQTLSATGEPTATTPVVAGTLVPFTISGTTVQVASVSATQSYQPPVTPTTAQVETTTLTLSNLGGSQQTVTIGTNSSFTNAAGFVQVPGNATFILSLASSSMMAGDTVSVTSTLTPTSPGGSTTLGPLMLTGAIPPTPAVPAASSAVNVTTQAFSITQLATITLAANTTLQFIVTSTLSAVPEPSSATMAFGGLPILGLLWARRRQQA